MNPLDNLMQALSMLGQGSSPQQQTEMRANDTLNRQGSLMGSDRADTRANVTAQGPAMSTMRDLVNALNPINWMGGPAGASSAVIAPTANKTLLGLLESLRGRAPKLVGAAEDTARTVFPYLTPGNPIPGAVGTYQNLNPLAGQVQVSGMQSGDEMLSTLAHELKHFLTDPSLANKNPSHAAETAAQIGSMLPPQQAGAMQRYVGSMPASYRDYLSGPAGEVAQRLGKGAIPLQEGKLGPASMGDPLRAYNESLSYLTEALLNPKTSFSSGSIKGGDPALEAIANALGHGIR